MFDHGPKRLRSSAVRQGPPRRLGRLPRRLEGPRTVGRPWPDRRWLLAGLGLLALIGLIGLLSLLKTDSPHPTVAGPPSAVQRLRPGPTNEGGVTRPTHGPGGESETGSEPPGPGPEEPPVSEPHRLYIKHEREIDNHQVTVEERKVSHPHHANFDLSLLALAALAMLSAPAVKRRKPVSGKLTRLVTPLALLVGLALVVASVHTWESPKPPKLVSLHTAEYSPEMRSEGVDRHREGNTIYVVHHFSREEPVRRLEHIHAWSLETSSQWPLLVLSAFLTTFLIRDRWAARRGRVANKRVVVR